ncbi:hypothetical protein [Streptomyces sp. NPDC058572]|uniref:hypothetical protein n=1 Tax=Streptomyces sp. NPDC058572 TaxID=3346546 RepID=UPI0036639E9E
MRYAVGPEGCWILKVTVTGTVHPEEVLEQVSVPGRTATPVVPALRRSGSRCRPARAEPADGPLP